MPQPIRGMDAKSGVADRWDDFPVGVGTGALPRQRFGQPQGDCPYISPCLPR